ncbi:MAG: EamA family transporter [Coriobacteriaceae bacterium]|nr:EamA family transporter [Coriobacteriaceae bacterium]
MTTRRTMSPARAARTHGIKLAIAFATLYIVWGSTYLAIRIGVQSDLPPALFGGLRLVPAGLILLGMARLRGTPLRVSRRDLKTTAVVGILLLCGGMYFTFLAEQYIPSGLAALVVALLPLWTAAAEWVSPDMERPGPLGLAGLVIGFCGLALLLWPRLTGLSGGSDELLGVGLQIVGTWLWTGGSVYSKRHPVRANAVVVTGYEMLIAGLVLLAWGTVLGEWPRMAAVNVTGFGALAYLILAAAVAFTAFVWALRNAPASRVMTYAFVNPVVAVFLGWLVLREPVDAWVFAGMTVIVAGVALATLAPTRPPRHAV